MTLTERSRLAVSIARDAAAGSLRERGPLRSAAYLASHCLTVARAFRFRVRETLFDREMRIHSDCLIDAADLGLKDDEVAGLAVNARGIAYMATPAWMLTKILKGLGIRFADYAFVDLGSGMGRAVLMAAAFPFRSVAGVEFSEELHRIAEDNLRRCPRQHLRAGSIEFACRDALEFPLPAGPLVIYMFNPFREPVMKRFVDLLKMRAPSDLIVIYLNPVQGHLLQQAPFLRTVKRAKFHAIYRS